MERDRFDSGRPQSRAPWPRRSPRIAVSAEVVLRRSGQHTYRVRVHNMSRHGCKIEFVERPKLDDRAWIKFDGLEALDALVCWVDGFVAGVEFEKPIHPAVFELLLKRLN